MVDLSEPSTGPRLVSTRRSSAEARAEARLRRGSSGDKRLIVQSGDYWTTLHYKCR